KRVASHARAHGQQGRHTTCSEHRPDAHRKHAEWSPSRLVAWAEKVGVNTKAIVTKVLETRRHPEQGYRTCLGLLRLTKTYGNDRVEAACARAMQVRAYSYRHVKSILENGLDRQPLLALDAEERSSADAKPIEHENVRGPGYYH